MKPDEDEGVLTDACNALPPAFLPEVRGVVPPDGGAVAMEKLTIPRSVPRVLRSKG